MDGILEDLLATSKNSPDFLKERSFYYEQYASGQILEGLQLINAEKRVTDGIN